MLFFLGCGTGRHLVFLAQNGFEVYGFDSSPNALKLSNKWLNNLNLIAETSLQKMEEDFPFENNFFDAVISIQVIHHNKAELVKKTVKEIERVMKKGGILFITIPDFHNYSRKHKWKLKEIENRTYIPLDGPEKGLIHHFFTKEEIHETFCNFKILEIGLDPTNHRYILA
ncbi:MAG: class I SAM-dependent methyltransferase [Candidatus Lokiarchaeota archaeon]